MTMPIAGTQIEVYGSLSTFLTADINAEGEITFTVRTTASNVVLICARAESVGSVATALSSTIVQVPAAACVKRYQGNSIENEGYLQAGVSESLAKVQKVLARRMRFSA